MMQVSVPPKSVTAGLVEPAGGEAGRTENRETPESSEAGVRSRTHTSKSLPVGSLRLVALPLGSDEKGPDARPQLAAGFSEWLLESCEAIDSLSAEATKSKG